MIFLTPFLEKYKIKSDSIRGIINVGAQSGSEYAFYKSNNIENIMFFEPCRDNFIVLKNTIQQYSVEYKVIDSGVKILMYGLGNKQNNEAEMIVEDKKGGENNSLLMPDVFLKLYPKKRFNKREKVVITTLDENLSSNNVDMTKFNLLSIDTNGTELDVIRGSMENIKYFDYILLGICKNDLYNGCYRIEQSDSLLKNLGFEKVEDTLGEQLRGYVFYKKK